MPALPDHDLPAQRSWVFLSVLPAISMAFLLGPLLRQFDDEWFDAGVRILFNGLVFLGMWAYSPSRPVTRSAVALVVLAATCALARPLGLLAPDSAFIAGASSTGALAALSLVIQLRYLMYARQVTAAHLASAVFAYVLIGLVWTFLYLLVWIGLSEPSFNGLVTRDEFLTLAGVHGAETVSLRGLVLDRLTYFSFVTLTTLGYGDITPRGPLAPGLATLEAVLGQVFLTVLVAHLVSLNLARRTQASAD